MFSVFDASIQRYFVTLPFNANRETEILLQIHPVFFFSAFGFKHPPLPTLISILFHPTRPTPLFGLVPCFPSPGPTLKRYFIYNRSNPVRVTSTFPGNTLDLYPTRSCICICIVAVSDPSVANTAICSLPRIALYSLILLSLPVSISLHEPSPASFAISLLRAARVGTNLSHRLALPRQ
jgi:hypothetical protein